MIWIWGSIRSTFSISLCIYITRSATGKKVSFALDVILENQRPLDDIEKGFSCLRTASELLLTKTRLFASHEIIQRKVLQNVNQNLHRESRNNESRGPLAFLQVD
ncbi:uncharacterized protein EI90DRAFT_3070906 [Cantharellus anzutake]|uniref:uncharacterized protein n=1 Tax=Cantharellus anzutake TaxID=1750568 RepID=UPI001904CBF1|nr:uncharacterized protein EI90DRAFT_3070906 [Cantharellus anzutake]KAF8326192.1 hypothetical protein EI90DRAFT_3070906 [Cantharellus anzutake]